MSTYLYCDGAAQAECSTYPVLVLALEQAGRDVVQLVRVHCGEPLRHLLIRNHHVAVGIHLLEDVGRGLDLEHLLVDADEVDGEAECCVRGNVLPCASAAVAFFRRDYELLLLAQA